MQKTNKSNPNGVRIFDIRYSKKDKKEMQKNIVKIMDEAFLSNHTFCRKIEKKLQKMHKVHNFLSCSSGTTALEAIFRFLKISKKAVLVQSNTFIATGHAIHAAGGIVVPFDLNGDFTASLNDLKKAYQECKVGNLRVGAVCVVNIAGRASLENFQIREFCDQEKIPLVEDNAQGMFSTLSEKYLGTIADYSAYSFHTTKIVACGEGGAISFRNKEDLEKLSSFITFGNSLKNNLFYDNFSGNFKLNELSAAFILMDLKRSKSRIFKRRKIDNIYKNNIKNNSRLSYLSQPKDNNPSFYKTIFKCDNAETRKEIEQLFLRNNIAMTGYVYKIPLHKQPRIFNSESFINRELPFTEEFCNTHITPPNYPELSKNNIDFIIDTLNKI